MSCKFWLNEFLIDSTTLRHYIGHSVTKTADVWIVAYWYGLVPPKSSGLTNIAKKFLMIFFETQTFYFAIKFCWRHIVVDILQTSMNFERFLSPANRNFYLAKLSNNFIMESFSVCVYVWGCTKCDIWMLKIHCATALCSNCVVTPFSNCCSFACVKISSMAAYLSNHGLFLQLT